MNCIIKLEFGLIRAVSFGKLAKVIKTNLLHLQLLLKSFDEQELEKQQDHIVGNIHRDALEAHRGLFHAPTRNKLEGSTATSTAFERQGQRKQCEATEMVFHDGT